MLHVLKMQIKLICFAFLFGLCVYVLKEVLNNYFWGQDRI